MAENYNNKFILSLVVLPTSRSLCPVPASSIVIDIYIRHVIVMILSAYMFEWQKCQAMQSVLPCLMACWNTHIYVVYLGVMMQLLLIKSGCFCGLTYVNMYAAKAPSQCCDSTHSLHSVSHASLFFLISHAQNRTMHMQHSWLSHILFLWTLHLELTFTPGTGQMFHLLKQN